MFQRSRERRAKVLKAGRREDDEGGAAEADDREHPEEESVEHLPDVLPVFFHLSDAR